MYIMLSVLACGVNVEDPAVPVPLSYPPAKAPVIESLHYDADANSFTVSYYISNEESLFLGYNLYVALAPSSLAKLLAGQTDNLYLARGIAPSFPHADDAPSADSAALQSQELFYRNPPPVVEPFYRCQLYYFRLTAYLKGGYESEASPELSLCSSMDAGSCPSASPCNP